MWRRIGSALLVSTWALASPGILAKAQAQQTVTCNDGSTSKAGRGACSHHGGVAKSSAQAQPAAPPAKETPKAAAAPPPSAQPPPATARKQAPSRTQPAAPQGEATARCKDGSYSYSKHHSGACSHHGGVAQWLDATQP